MRIEYVFTILFLALGPLRVIPVFYEFTDNADRAYRVRVAIFATLISAAIVAVTALAGAETIQSWHISTAALDIAIGILLLRSTFSSISRLEAVMQHTSTRAQEARTEQVSAAALAFSPIAAPTIVSPTGVVTIVLFVSLAQDEHTLRNQIYGVLLFLLALNFVGMLSAGFVIRVVRESTLAIVGWIFAALQAALAVEVTLVGLRLAGFMPRC